MKKLLVFLVLAGGAAGGGYYYWRNRRAAAQAEAQKPPTAKVERGPIRLTVASTGRVVANLDVEIKCKASGEVRKLPFDISNTVEKGQLLLEIDPVDEQRVVKQADVDLSASQAKLAKSRQNLLIAQLNLKTSRKKAEATLRSAQARAREAEAKASRMKQLLEKKLASEEDADAAATAAVQAAVDLETAQVRIEELKSEELGIDLYGQEVALAAAQVESDQIDRSIAQQRLDDTTVVAPISGVITTRSVQIGQIISSGISNVGGGTAVLTLSDLSRIFVLASVDESDIGKVVLDGSVLITVDAFPSKRFRGKVTRIAPKGVVVSNVVTFEVKIEVLEANKKLLRPEMTANVEILVAEKADALTVPTEAVVRRKAQQVATVVKDDGTTEERPIEVGINDGLKIEVTKGLQEGELVVARKGQADSAWRKAQPSGPPGMMLGPVRGGK